MIVTVNTKLTKASMTVVPIALPSTSRFSEVPPSNKITTSAMVAINEPIWPKSSAVTIPSKGPITMPTSISISTSGMLVMRNCTDRKCAKNSISPIISMVVDIFASGYLTWADYTYQSLYLNCSNGR